MGKLEILCPSNPMDIQEITLNGEDCGPAQGITRILFEIVPDSPPTLSIERISLGKRSGPRFTEVKFLEERGEAK